MAAKAKSGKRELNAQELAAIAAMGAKAGGPLPANYVSIYGQKGVDAYNAAWAQNHPTAPGTPGGYGPGYDNTPFLPDGKPNPTYGLSPQQIQQYNEFVLNQQQQQNQEQDQLNQLQTETPGKLADIALNAAKATSSSNTSAISRGLFKSSIRDANLADIDRTRYLNTTAVQDALRTASSIFQRNQGQRDAALRAVIANNVSAAAQNRDPNQVPGAYIDATPATLPSVPKSNMPATAPQASRSSAPKPQPYNPLHGFTQTEGKLYAPPGMAYPAAQAIVDQYGKGQNVKVLAAPKPKKPRK